MDRKPLMKGDTINGKFLYEIETVSGTGASCVVYKARYCDDKKQSHLVQIKEFYPYTLEIYREKNSNNLICTDAEQFEFEKCRFINNAKKLASFNNDEITNSGTPFQVEIFETHQTAYSVVAYDAGDIYSEENLQTMELAKLLEIIKNLARAVELFHKNGYVHFDIKPENFLVDNTDHITLFDIDSVTSCDEIDNETIQNISHTKKWAAPEVRQAAEKGKNTNVSYAADIYSIGLILFEAIMCRDFIYPSETIPYNRNWDIENSIKAREEKQNRKANINPKFYYKIKEILGKTLDRNPDNRYETAKELKSALVDAITLYNQKVYLISSHRPAVSNFIGRNVELKEIHNALQENDTVFLHGFGGIGKTELALKYAQKHKEDFDAIVFCKYDNNLKETLKNIKPANYNHQDIEKILDDLPNLLDERVLIILDNFDLKKPNSDPYFKENFLKLNCKKIITTRRDFFRDLGIQIHVNHLDKDSMRLFKQECKWNSADDGKEEIVEEIFNLIQSHTLFIVAVARMKTELDLSIEELLNNVKENLLDDDYEICDMNEETLKVIAEKLFNMNYIGNDDNETAEYQQVLRNLYALKWRTVTLSDYKEIACYGLTDKEKIKQQNLLNKLVRRGWVQTADFGEKQEYFLHPILQELVKNKLGVNTEDLTNLLDYYKNLLSTFFSGSIMNLKFVQTGKFTKQILYVYSHHIKELIALCDVLLDADNECSINRNSAYITNNLLKFISCDTFPIKGTESNVIMITKLMAKLLKSVCPGMHKKEYYKLLSKHMVFSLAFGNIVYAKDIKGNEIYEFNDIISAKNFDYNNIVHFTFSEMSLDEYARSCLSYYNNIHENFDDDSDYIDIFLSTVYPYLNLIILNMDNRINKEHFQNSDTQKLWDILRNDLNDEHILRCEKTANKYLNENKSDAFKPYEGHSKEFFKYSKIIHNEDVNLYEILESIEKSQTLSILEKIDLKVELRRVCYQDVEKNAKLIIELLEHSCFDCISVEDKSDEYNDWIKESFLLLAYSYVDEKKCFIYAKKLFSIIDSIPYKDDFDYLLEISSIMHYLYSVFSKENKVDKMFDLICNYVTDRIDFFEKKEINTFELYEWLSKLVDQLYIETNNEKYRELSNNYKSKMNELSDINYEIKD